VDANRKVWAMLAVLLMLGGVMAASGCIGGDENGDDDDKVKVPDDRKDAKLTITGNGASVGIPPIEVTIQDMVDLGLVDFEATFVNSVGTSFTANYTGIPLTEVFTLNPPSNVAEIVEVEASDGYVATFILGDIDETTFIALKEEGEWNDLADGGAFRLVDTDLPSVYWVRQISEIRILVHDFLLLWTDSNMHWDFITMGWIHEHSTQTVSWQEGDRTRTYKGVPIATVAEEAGLNTTIDNYVSLIKGDDYTILPSTNATTNGFLVVDSQGDYVYFQEDEDIVIKGLTSVSIASGFHIGGAVGNPYNGEWKWLESKTPNEIVEYKDNMYLGPLLSWLVAESAPDADADAVRVTAGDGYFAVFPISTLGTSILSIFENMNPFEGDVGQLRVIDANRSGNFHVGWVVEMDVFVSENIEALGSVNMTDVLFIGNIATNSDTNISYNDGRRDRTYPGMTWDAVLDIMDADTTATTVTLVNADEQAFEWDIADLLGRTDSGLFVDSRGDYVAYDGASEEVVSRVVSIEVS
jgi:hypothetical protein